MKPQTAVDPAVRRFDNPAAARQQSEGDVDTSPILPVGRHAQGWARLALTLYVGLLPWAHPLVSAQGAQVDALARARQFYNQREYDKAIDAAAEARRMPANVDAATLVFARAHLERYQQKKDASDLDTAREALAEVDDAKLSLRDHAELTIGFGESLYFDRLFSAAAEFFEGAFARLDLLEPGARERLFEWWANALDQQAQLGPASERRPQYERILDRAQQEFRRDDHSAVASYWLAAAACGANDFDHAWGAAQAGWIRAPLTGAAGAKLRADLDRLVTTVIIPARALQLSPATDPHPAMTILQQEWDEMKQKYGK